MKHQKNIVKLFLNKFKNCRWGVHELFLSILLLLLLGAGFALISNPLKRGLRVAYYDNTEWGAFTERKRPD